MTYWFRELRSPGAVQASSRADSRYSRDICTLFFFPSFGSPLVYILLTSGKFLPRVSVWLAASPGFCSNHSRKRRTREMRVCRQEMSWASASLLGLDSVPTNSRTNQSWGGRIVRCMFLLANLSHKSSRIWAGVAEQRMLSHKHRKDGEGMIH